MTVRRSDDGWFVTGKPSPRARLRLFCLPYAGGGAHLFRDWTGALAPEIDVCAARLPGRERRLGTDPYTSIDPLVDDLVEAVAPRLDLPFAIFGHSMGAVIGFELSRRLRRDHGREPLHLIASARFAPHVPDPDPPIHALPHDEFVAEVRDLDGTPPEVFDSPELMELLLPMLRADFSVCETYTYRHEPPLACPISIYGGLGDETIEREALESWREQTTGAFALRMFAGDHFFIQSAQSQLLEVVRRELLQHAPHALR